MGKYKIRDQHGLHFVTLTVVDWMDVFIRYNYKEIILDSLRHCQKAKGLKIYSYVLMSSHLHLIVKAEGDIPLWEILRDFKKFTARKIINLIGKSNNESRKEWLLKKMEYKANTSTHNRKHKFWQTDNHPIDLYSLHVIAQKVQYIHQNPVKEGWVASAEHYLYSSASNYATGVGLLNVELIDLPMSWVGYVPVMRLD